MAKSVVFLFLIFSPPVFSRWVVDAHFGYGEVPNTTEQKSEILFKGVEAGLRVGLGHSLWMIGLDGSYGWMDSKFQNLSSSEEIPMKKLDLGGFFGIEFLGLIRMWVSYFPISDWYFDYINSPKLQGRVMGGGVGLSILPYVSINGEIKLYNMDKFTDGSNSVILSGDEKIQPFEVGISLALVF